MKPNFISSISRIDYRITIAFAALIGVGYFLLASAMVYRIGFPLDDAWIHQTYARNLALYGEWSYRPGMGSGGSTSPLWTLLLSVGYLLRLGPYVWTFFLGWCVLSVTAIYAETVARRILTSYHPMFPWVGLFIALAWHLTWSAVSGMETLLHGLLILVVLCMLMENSRQYLTLGLLAGVSIWVRPDGLTLLGPILLMIFVSETTWRARGSAFVKVFIGFGILFGIYLLFNLALSGSPMPNTFYAKQAEYGEYWHSVAMKDRITNYLLPIVASPFVVLLPGFFVWLVKAVQEKRMGILVGVVWALGYISIFFVRLPAYQHGRYMIPVFPILYLWGMLGMLFYFSTQKPDLRVVVLWSTILGVLVLSFQWVGAKQNSADVVFIESQMVQTAQWINETLPPGAVLGIHDIGAIGFVTPNPLVDLAGLITPDVVPFIRNEKNIADFMSRTGVDYFVTFPTWYPELSQDKIPIFQASDTQFLSTDFMSVYPWP